MRKARMLFSTHTGTACCCLGRGVEFVVVVVVLFLVRTLLGYWSTGLRRLAPDRGVGEGSHSRSLIGHAGKVYLYCARRDRVDGRPRGVEGYMHSDTFILFLFND